MGKNSVLKNVKIHESAYVDYRIKLTHGDPSAPVRRIGPSLRMTGHLLGKGRRIKF